MPFYNAETKGFYVRAEEAPAGSVEISQARKDELHAGEAAGLVIEADGDGYPQLVEREAVQAVPASVTMRQARLALLADGKLALVDPAIDSLPEPDRSAARIEWDYSSVVVRDRPFVNLLGAAVGYSQERIDELFIAAAQL